MRPHTVNDWTYRIIRFTLVSNITVSEISKRRQASKSAASLNICQSLIPIQRYLSASRIRDTSLYGAGDDLWPAPLAAGCRAAAVPWCAPVGGGRRDARRLRVEPGRRLWCDVRVVSRRRQRAAVGGEGRAGGRRPAAAHDARLLRWARSPGCPRGTADEDALHFMLFSLCIYCILRYNFSSSAFYFCIYIFFSSSTVKLGTLIPNKGIW